MDEHPEDCECWICDVATGCAHLGRASEDAPVPLAVAIRQAIDTVRRAAHRLEQDIPGRGWN